MQKRMPFFLILLLLNQLTFTVKGMAEQITVDTIDVAITNVTIVDVVNEKIIDAGPIYIDKGKIISLDPAEKFVARRVIDGKQLVALPGFINTHTHLWQHVSKSSAPNDKLQDWIRIYQPIHYLTEDEIYNVVLAACSEAFLSGITSVSDYASLAFNDYALNGSCRAMKDAGMGGVVIWHNPSIFIPDSLKGPEIVRVRNKYKDDFDIWMGHGPLSFHSVPQVFSAIPIANKLELHISEHCMENIQEQRDYHAKVWTYLNDFGAKLAESDRIILQQTLDMPVPSSTDSYYLIEQKARLLLDDPIQNKCLTTLERQKLQSISGSRTVSPFPLLQSWGILKSYLAIHAVWPQKEDLEIMRKNNVSVSHNPESNMYLSSGIAPVYQYKKEDILMSIGTDGAASNDGIDFFSAMKNMWNLNKINLMNASIKDVNEWDVLRAATINGAKALLIESKTGSIDVGKEADIILLKKQTLGLAPYKAKTLAALIIYSANPSSIEYVLSNGKVIVQSAMLVNSEERQLADQLSAIAAAGERRNAEGKQWSETFTLDASAIGQYWYKYRSVRKLDEFNLKFQNTSNNKIKLYFASSGTRFGGGSPLVIDPVVSKRYPENQMPGSFLKEVILSPQQSIEVIKDKDGFKYTFTIKGKKEQLNGAAGQFLVAGFIQKK